jgi:uncharacterized small protein (DUF1192 family)
MSDYDIDSANAAFLDGGRPRRPIELDWLAVSELADREGITRAEVLRFQIELATKALMAMERIPNPAAWSDETVVSFWQKISGRTYSFVAIKAKGRWYLSGTRSRSSLTDDRFRERLASPFVTNIRLMDVDNAVTVIRGE